MTMHEMAQRVLILEKEIERLETLEVSTAAPPGVGAITHIETLSSSSSSFVFDNIPATYRHLVFTGHVRSMDAGEFDYLTVGFNGVAPPNAAYDSFLNYYAGGAATQFNQAQRIIGALFGAQASPTLMFSPFTFWVYFYALTDLNRQIHGASALGRDATAPDIEAMTFISSGHWKETSNAIDEVYFECWAGAANFQAGSTISCYGISGP